MIVFATLLPSWLAGLCGARPTDGQPADPPADPIGTLTYTEGNALLAKVDVLAHGTNSIGVMGAGIAAQIARRWPHINRAYHAACQEDDLLGSTQVLATGDPPGTAGPRFVANVMTQTLSKVPFTHAQQRNVEYDATDAALHHLCEILETSGLRECAIAMPRIGAGLGGGDWNILEAIIRSTLVAAGHHVTVYDFNPKPGE